MSDATVSAPQQAKGSECRTPLASASLPTSPSPESGIDIYITFNSQGLDPAGLAPVEVFVGNGGNTDATDDVKVILITPFFANFDAALHLNPYFTQYIVRNPNPNIPEIAQLTIPKTKLTAGAKVSTTVNLTLVSGGPQLLDYVVGFVDPGSNTELTLLNNEAVGTVAVPIQPLRTVPLGANVTNLYYTFLQPRVKAGATTQMQIYLGNKGPSTPKSDPVFSFVTPFHVKIDRNDLAFQLRNPTYYHDFPDPSIPDIVSFTVPRLLLPPDPNLLIDILGLNIVNIPLIAYEGGYSNRGGKGMFATGGLVDFDPNLAVAINHVSIIQPT